MKTSILLPVLLFTLIALPLSAADVPKLDPHLEPLRPFLDKTWKGEFKNSRPDQPIVDVARWERALNGNAVRILHSINNGSYGGETIIMWDKKKQAVAYHYFTTAGFMTVGTMTFKDNRILTHETVSGNSDSVSEVKGTTEMLRDGSFVVKTEYRKGDAWTPGRETTYREDASAKVLFK